jgi:hypothetical protein
MADIGALPRAISADPRTKKAHPEGCAFLIIILDSLVVAGGR